MAKLAEAAAAPGVHAALLIDVGCVVLTACEVTNFLQESLDACRMAQLDRVEARNAELPVAIVAEGIELSIRVHKDRVVCSAQDFLDLHREIQFLGLSVVLEITVAELPVAALAPGPQLTVLSDAGCVLEATSNLLDFLRNSVVLNIQESQLRLRLSHNRRVGSRHTLFVLTVDLLRQSQLPMVTVSHHQQLPVSGDRR